MTTTERTAYTVTGCTPAGPIYLDFRRGTRDSRRRVFASLKQERQQRTLWDLRIHRWGRT